MWSLSAIQALVAADGRDVPDGSSVEYVQRLQADLEAIEQLHEGCSARIASGGGRMRVTMDRYEVCRCSSPAGQLTTSCKLDLGVRA